MIRITFCLRRQPHLSPEEFRRYWLEEHGPRVKKHRQALGIKRYVQLHADHGPFTEMLGRSRNSPEPFDGVAEVWFESLEELQAHGATPEGKAAGRDLYQDEKTFIDFAHSPIFIGEEKEIVAAE